MEKYHSLSKYTVDTHDQHYLDFMDVNRHYTDNKTKRDLGPNMENTTALFLSGLNGIM